MATLLLPKLFSYLGVIFTLLEKALFIKQSRKTSIGLCHFEASQQSL